MSKRLLSAILAIAMVASLCASVFTVGTSAATNYEADRAVLKKAIYDLFVKGPTVSESTRNFLVDTGILTDACTASDGCAVTDGELERAKVFKIAMPACKYNHANGAYDATEAYIGVAATLEYEVLLCDAASAYYFGQKADELLVDASFNAGRNSIIKNYTKQINAEMKKLEAVIGGFTAGKPGYDAVNKVAAEKSYAGVYEAWVSTYHNGAYNPNFGINPYAGDKVLGENVWQNILANYAGANVFPLWHSFDEMRADSTVAPLLVKFERLYREAQTFSAEGMLFYDFVAKKAELENAWAALIAALRAKYTWTASTPTASAKEAIVAFNTLCKVVEFYDLYIADAYINVYTSASQELLSNIAIAKLVREFVKANKGAAAYAIGVEYFNNLKDALVANIAALDPAAASLNLTAGDIAEAVALIKDAQALASAYSVWAGKDGYKETLSALNTAIANLKVLIPYDSVSAAIYTIPANSTASGIVDLDNKTEVKDNNAVTIAFMPNYFALIRFEAALEEAIAAMQAKINVWNNTIDKLGSISSAANLSKDVLKNALHDLDFLAGYNLDSSVCSTFVADYQGKVAKFLPTIVSITRAHNNIDDDQAATQFEAFVTLFEEALAIYNAADPKAAAEATTNFKGLNFNKSAWDWETGSYVGEKNDYGKVAEKLYAFLPYLTASLEQIINFYAFIGETVAIHFGVAVASTNDFADKAAYVDGAYDAFAKAVLQLLVNCEKADAQSSFPVKPADYKITKGNVTATSLKADYEAFISATKALLTDRGVKLLDQFIEDVQSWISLNWKGGSYDNKFELYEKLYNLGMRNAFELPTAAAEPYLYYNLTLNHVANKLASTANKYKAGAQFTETIYNPLATKAKLAADADLYYIVNYDTEWSADFAAIRETAGQVLNLMNADGTSITSDIPLYYVLNVIAALDAMLDSANEHHVDTLAAYKAETLLPAIVAASDISMYDYDTASEDGAKIWKAYEAAFNAALAAKYDNRMPKAKIDEIVANLAAAVEALELVKKTEASATKADLEALIVAAEALLARADDVDTAAKLDAVNALKAAIPAAKQFIVGYNYSMNFNNSYDLDAQVAALQAAIDAVDEALYFADDLTAYLTIIAANAAGYEAMHTAESYAALVLAFSNALEVAQNANLNASAYVAASDAVKAAVAALVVKPAPVEPEEPAMTKTFEAAVAKLAELKAVSTEGFTAESVSAFNEAVARLEIAIKTVAADDVLLEFIANAYIAKAQLATIVVENPTTCD